MNFADPMEKVACRIRALWGELAEVRFRRILESDPMEYTRYVRLLEVIQNAGKDLHFLMCVCGGVEFDLGDYLVETTSDETTWPRI